MKDEAKPPAPALTYRLLSILLAPVWALHALRHGWQHGLGAYPRMRLFGFAQSDAQIWVHASSVGEVNAVAPLVEALVERGEKVLLTSFTATGYHAIHQHFADRVTSGIVPFDNWLACRLFFRGRSIRLGLIVETELWPELLYQARRHDISLLLINARLSAKSLDTTGLLRRILARTLACFDRVLTRNRADLEAFTSLGADSKRIRIVGNLKSRVTVAVEQPRLVQRDYLLLASSHEGEETRFLEAKPQDAEPCLIVLAPRHPQRAADIERQISSLGLRYAVRSRSEPVTAATEVYLADTLGELAALMAHARVVVMGGSFDDTGGHNLSEPASLGCAIITGPADANISADIEMLGIGHGVLQVEDMAACWRAIGELLTDPGRAVALGREARERLAAQPDIVERYLEEIRPFLPPKY